MTYFFPYHASEEDILYIAFAGSNNLCIIFTLIILIGATVSSRKHRDLSTKLFIALCSVELFALVNNLFWYTYEGKLRSVALLTYLKLMTYVMIDVILIVFALYAFSFVSRKKRVHPVLYGVTIAVAVIDILQLIHGTITGKLFVVVDYHCVTGALSNETAKFPTIYYIWLYATLFYYRKYMSKRQIIAISSYLLIPLLDAIMRVLYPVRNISYVWAAVCLQIIYAIEQSHVIYTAQIREKILKEASNTDPLTGLKNRRSFDETLRSPEMGVPSGVIFCDINSLKYENDNFGHSAGDALISRFADILCSAITDGEVFRISGDEFVVLFYKVGDHTFNKQVRDLSDKINAHNRIASIGYVCGGEDAFDMVGQAEQAMYADKERYYRETGKDRRT